MHHTTDEHPANRPGTWRSGQVGCSSAEESRFDRPRIPASVPLSRRRVEHVAREMGFRETQLRDLLIAVSEAATNALKHGSPGGEESRITPSYEPDGDRLIIEVSDEGP